MQRTIGGGTGNIPGITELEELLSPSLSIVRDNAPRPVLAEAIPSTENGLWTVLPDGGMESTWRIRPGARWRDGTPVRAEDLLLTAQVDVDPTYPIPRNAAYDAIDRLEAPDLATLNVTWKRPYIDADQLFSVAVFPRHLLEPTYEETKDTLMTLAYWTTDFVGTGPYRVKQWAPDVHLVLAANEDYTLGRPKIDEIVVKYDDRGQVAE